VPYEFKDFLGFLSVIKIQQSGQLSSMRPTYAKYGLKRDRRKLYIEPLHLPPEDAEKGRGETSRPVKQSASSSSSLEINTNETEEVSGSAEVQLRFEDEDRKDGGSAGATASGMTKLSIRPVAISSFKNTGGADAGGTRMGSQGKDQGAEDQPLPPRRFNLADSKARAARLMSLGGGESNLSNKNLDF
jgi:hypothetical protein